jgi:LacI family transcriptional regulator, galactose operon repressor
MAGRQQPPPAPTRSGRSLETARRPTMVDVARLAGTSPTTVSNVIHGHVYVRPETRARVLAAIQTLGYHINVTARSLARQRTNVLGVVLGDLENFSYASLAANVERHAYAHGYTALIVSTGGELETEASRIQTLIEHQVAAIIFFTFSGNTEVVRAIPHQTPMVFVSVQGPAGASIAVDSRLGAHLAVSHLIGLGHSRIAYASTTLGAEPMTDEERFAGYRHALALAGLPAPDERLRLRLRHPPHSQDDVQAAIDGLLSVEPRPTAVFAASDFTAIEILERADVLGLGVPTELSIVGFDDIRMSSLARISLTTVAHPIPELAARGVETAVALASGQPDKVRPHVLLEPKLVVRSTTGPAPSTPDGHRSPSMAPGV